MKINNYNVTMRLLSPLIHIGDDKSGTTSLLRKQKFLVGEDYIDVPVYSGNALRGILRGLIMRDYCERIGLSVKSLSQTTFYMLFNGGSLQGGAGIENLSLKEKIVECCPPLVLLGSALGTLMTKGKLKVGICKPICKELNDYNINQAENSIYSDMRAEVFHTRMDRLKADTDTPSIEGEKKVVQMKYEAETLSAGTVLETRIVLENASDIEISCFEHMMKLLEEDNFIGCKSGSGYGEIALNIEYTDGGKAYLDWLEANKEDATNFVNMLNGVLK